MTSLCFNCKQPSVIICSNCKLIHYCSKACQKQDWPKHIYQCKTGFCGPDIVSDLILKSTTYNLELENKTIQSLFSRYLAKNFINNKLIILTNKDKIVIKELKKAIQFNPNNDAAYNNLAIYYKQEHKFNKAMRLQYRAIELNPNEGSYVLNYCTLLYKQKNKKEFEKWCKFLFQNHTDIIEQLGIIEI